MRAAEERLKTKVERALILEDTIHCEVHWCSRLSDPPIITCGTIERERKNMLESIERKESRQDRRERDRRREGKREVESETRDRAERAERHVYSLCFFSLLLFPGRRSGSLLETAGSHLLLTPAEGRGCHPKGFPAMMRVRVVS